MEHPKPKLPRRALPALFGTALAALTGIPDARATVSDLETLQKANANLLFQYGFEGEDDSARLSDGSANGHVLQRTAGADGGSAADVRFLPGLEFYTSQAYHPASDPAGYRRGAGLNTVNTAVPVGTSITIEAVIQMDDYQPVVSNTPPTISQNGSYLISSRPTGKQRGYFFRQGGYQSTLGETNTLGSTYGDTFTDYVTSLNPYTPGDWYYVASVASYNTGTNITTVTWYVANLTAGDTTLTVVGPDTTTFAGDWTGSSQVGIGNFTNGSQEFFQGAIETIALTNQALAPSEVEARFDALLLSPPDEDGDGLPDAYELAFTDPPSTTALVPGIDVEPDGLTTLQEYELSRTNPVVADSDGDSLADGAEFSGASNPYDNTPTDPNNPDTDGDGADDGQEAAYPTDPHNPDTDGDNMPDGYELLCQTPGTALDPTTQDADQDNDNDGLDNIAEYDPLQGPNINSPRTRADLADTDNDGLEDSVEDNYKAWGGEQYTGTDPTKPDSDGDGLLDGQENFDLGSYQGSGVIPAFCDPNTPHTDEDGFTDGYEVLVAGTDPFDNGSAPTQSAGFVLVEDFEGTGMVSGQTFHGVNGWSSSTPSATRVLDEPVAGGDKVGSLSRPDSATFTSLSKSLDALALHVRNGGTGTLFLQIYATSIELNHNFGFADVATPTDFPDYETQVGLTNAGVIGVRPPTAFTPTGYNYASGRWMNVWIVANNDLDVMHVHFESPDGETGRVAVTPSGSGFRQGTLSALGTLFLRNGNSAVGESLYFDNIYVDPVAENLSTPAPAKPTAVAATELKIENVGFNGGVFEVTVSGLKPTGTYRLMRGASPDTLTETVETISGPTATDTFSDTSPPALKAFYRVQGN